MNQSGLTKTLIIFIIVILLGVVGYLILVKEKFDKGEIRSPSATTEQVRSYINQRLGYVISLPDGYRIASDYTEFMNTTGPNSIRSYKEENAEYVLITKNNKDGEAAFLREAQKVAESKDFLFIPQSSLAQSSLRNSIEIYPTPASIDSIKELAGKMRDRGRNASSDFRDVVLADGTNVTRYTEGNIGDNEILEVVYIPLRMEKYLRGGDKIEGITIKLNKRSEIFDNAVFEKIIKSFRLVQ